MPWHLHWNSMYPLIYVLKDELYTWKILGIIIYTTEKWISAFKSFRRLVLQCVVYRLYSAFKKMSVYINTHICHWLLHCSYIRSVPTRRKSFRNESLLEFFYIFCSFYAGHLVSPIRTSLCTGQPSSYRSLQSNCSHWIFEWGILLISSALYVGFCL